MLDKLNEQAADALAQAMETLAFVVPAAAERLAPGPGHAVLVSMPFSGPVSGVVEMVAGEELGATLAANTLTAEAASAEGGAELARRGQDALKELLNITCGALLSGAGAAEGRRFDISLPRLSAFDAATEWQGFISTPGARVLDADGALVAIRVKSAA